MTTSAPPTARRGDPSSGREPSGGVLGRRSHRVIVLGASVAIAVVVLLVAVAATGAATPTLLADPGAVVRWGLPIAELLVNLACTLAIGSLAICAVVIPGSSRAWPIAQRTAAAASIAWTIGYGVQLVLTYSQIAGRPLGGPTFGEELGIFLGQVELGRAMLWGLVLAALTTLAAVASSRAVHAVGSLVLALVALAPVASTGHAAGAANHALAVSGLWVHLGGVTLWIGALAALVLIAPAVRPLTAAAERFSALALWAFALVAVSGVASAAVRIGDLQALTSPYGILVLLKVGATLLLGVAGWWHRRRAIPQLTTGRTAAFWRLVIGEVLLAGAVMGLAVALSRTAPPVPDTPLESSPVEIITGFPAPLPPDAARWFTLWRPDLLVLIGVVSAAVVVVTWYLRLRRRGDAWPIARVASLFVGLALIAWVSSGGPAVYGVVLFSGHMVQHMVLVMLAPIFLVLGAPVTLALRAVRPRSDGSLGPRELLLGLVHSRWAGFFANPVVAAVNVVGSMIVFYFTPLFLWSMTSHWVHLWMIVHFTLAGYMFVNVLVGIDPGPKRPSFPLRLLLLFATMAFHAFFGLALTEGTQLLAASWYGALGLPWGVDALADQRVGGAFAWGFGEIPSLLLAIALGLAWIRDDERAARRLDRKADRDGDAELAAYNARLAGYAARPERAAPERPSPERPTPERPSPERPTPEYPTDPPAEGTPR